MGLAGDRSENECMILVTTGICWNRKSGERRWGRYILKLEDSLAKSYF